MKLRLPAGLIVKLCADAQEQLIATQVHSLAHATVREARGEEPGGETLPTRAGGWLAFHSAPDIELARLESAQKRFAAMAPDALVEVDLDPPTPDLWAKARKIGGRP